MQFLPACQARPRRPPSPLARGSLALVKVLHEKFERPSPHLSWAPGPTQDPRTNQAAARLAA